MISRRSDLKSERCTWLVEDEVDFVAAVTPMEKAHPGVHRKGAQRCSDQVLHQVAELDRITEGRETSLQRSVADGSVDEVELAAAVAAHWIRFPNSWGA